MLYIKAYRSNKYSNTSIHRTNRIYFNEEPISLTEEDREALRNGNMIPMACFEPLDEDTSVICIPLTFIIKIWEE